MERCALGNPTQKSRNQKLDIMLFFNDSIKTFHTIFAAMKFSWPLLSLLALFLFTSCEKELNIPLQASEPKLVVEGSISTDQQPYLILTKSIGFFAKIDLNTAEFVQDAEVFVTDLTVNKKIQLKSFVSPLFTFYSIESTDPEYNHFQKGIVEHIYQLDIKYENQIYTAVAKIPNNVGLDSLYFEPNSSFNDTLFSLKAVYSDPDTLGNFYKYFTKRVGINIKDSSFLEPFSSRFDDTYINGQKNLPYDLFLGFTDTDTVDNEFAEGRVFANIGDTVTIKLSAMDRGVYNFWKTLEFAAGSIGNPFAAPIQVQTNVSNDALGIWAAYNNKYKTVINKP